MAKINELEDILKKTEREIKNIDKVREKNQKIYWETSRNLILGVGEDMFIEYFGKFKELEQLNELEKKRKEKSPDVIDDKGNIKENVWGEINQLKNDIKDSVYNKFVNLLNVSDEEKIVLGEYLVDKKIILSCGGFGFYKNPTSCGSCQSGEELIDKLDLKKYAEFTGDRCYHISEEIKENALDSVLSLSKIDKKFAKKTKKLKQTANKLKELSSVENLKEKKNNLESVLRVYKILDESKLDYEEVEKQMPDFFDEIKRDRDKSGVIYATANPKKGVGVILTDDWYYSGTGGCEYGVTAIVIRNGKAKEEYFKYRDSYDPNKDDWRYSFKEAKINKITDEEVEIKLKSTREGPFEITRTFSLPKQKRTISTALSEGEQNKFTAKFNEIEKKLINDHSKPNAIMPRYMNFWGSTGTLPCGTDTGQMVPYEKPQIIDKYIDTKNGIAAIVIKSQIDHDPGRGKQYQWSGYKINKQGKLEMVTSDNAYQLALKEGKKIVMKAKDLVK